jgi:hypothetical protein
VLPLAHVKSLLFGNALTSLPFAVYGGVAAVDEEAAGGARRRGATAGPQPGRGPPRIAQRAARHADWPTQDLYVTFRKENPAREEANMLAIPRKQRAMVRKGIKNG